MVTQKILIDLLFYFYFVIWKLDKCKDIPYISDDNPEESNEDRNVRIGKDKIKKWREMKYAERLKWKMLYNVKVVSCIKTWINNNKYEYILEYHKLFFNINRFYYLYLNALNHATYIYIFY